MSEYEQIVPASYPQRHPHAFVAPHTGGMDEGLDSCRAEREDNMRCLWPRAQHRWPCSPTCTHDDAWTPGHPERVKALSKEMTDMEPDAFEQGAEAMRAACWEAVARFCDLEGLNRYQREALMAAIEGATP